MCVSRIITESSQFCMSAKTKQRLLGRHPKGLADLAGARMTLALIALHPCCAHVTCRYKIRYTTDGSYMVFVNICTLVYMLKLPIASP